MASDTDRFLALVCRELRAVEARIVPPGATGANGVDHATVEAGGTPHAELRAPLAAGGVLAVRFAGGPEDRETTQRRLEMLASTFDVPPSESPRPSSRPPVARSLQDELEALRGRAGAVNVVVIDANSPVVWGAASPDELPLDDDAADRSAPTAAESPSLRAIAAVRALPDVAALSRGKRMRYVQGVGSETPPVVAHSFAGIYLLVVVFDAPFDELRAERAVLDALERVERLVLALPPLDPAPTQGAGAIALRRPRRR